MEAGQGCLEESFGIKSSSSTCEILDGRHDGVSSKMEMLPLHTGPCVDQHTPGKQKKSFKFFGGRKSICTLPSFFGGKHKGLAKRNSKKSLSKSKTHDCISNVPGEDGKNDYSDNIVSRHQGQDNPKTSNTLSSSHSADSGITSPVKLDFNFHDVSPMGSTECFDKKINAEKSFSFPRPKKGLKGLFSSIRRHKKNKTPDPEKLAQNDHNKQNIALEKLNNKYRTKDGDLQDISEQPKMNNLEYEVPPECSLNVTVVCEQKVVPSCSVNLATHTIDESLLESNEKPSLHQHHAINSELDCSDCPIPEEVFTDPGDADYIDRHTPSHSAGDQLSLIFEDVSSLKSFDSLTGCGDIIAEQDIDNISDNSISLERNREATKRSSCLVAYQGGGEEMATPDDMEEEYLQQLLEDGSGPDASYELENEKEQEEMSKGFMELEANADSMVAEDASVEGTGLSNTELLTPQSDQQESAPNSDEGYYDSTTPGPDDDAKESVSHKERLPRDSYSGDALYEFYEPDDSLMSPAPGGESLYDGKTLCSEIFDQFFDFSLPINSGSMHNIKRKKGATETEEERLAVIQKQLLLWERQREAALQGLDCLNKDIFPKEKQTIECEIRTANLMGRNKECLIREQVLVNVNKDEGNKGIQQSEKQSWKDFKDTSLIDSIYQGSYMQHVEKNSLVEKPGFELNVDSLEAQDHGDTRMARVTEVTNLSVSPMHHVQNVFGMEFCTASGYSQENECEQAVNFSQTLVEFANNGMLFSSISERLGCASSNSSFHQNLNSLPTMVTFDIVDVENEGECDQQMKHRSDDNVVSSFEGFDHSYVQESLAECDEQLLQMDTQHSFHSYNWGVASLPRHLDQYKLSPCRPVPLSLNRRSKSLDTESLELELGGLHMSKSGLKSYDLLTPWERGKNTWQYEDTCEMGDDASFNSCSNFEPIVQTNGQCETYTLVLSSKHGHSREPQGSSSSSQLPGDPRQMAKTTTELLLCNTRQSQEGSNSCSYSRENTTKKLARVLPMEEQRRVEKNYEYHATSKQIKTKPVGITQAMPQMHKKEECNPLTYLLERSGPAKKGTLEYKGTSPNDWSNNYSECSNG
ncbi:APC membrane recruitment protein 1 [Pseudophryne corroboree]|uniref:APC membrane recruitment protein 1 n=1 Tax=Pseudophryne corroboree TaxID=495146 RepID=UPI0030812909